MGDVFPIEIYVCIAKHSAPRDAALLLSSCRATRRAKQLYLEKAIECYKNGMEFLLNNVRHFKKSRIFCEPHGLFYRNAGRLFCAMSAEDVPLYWRVYACISDKFDNYRVTVSVKMQAILCDDLKLLLLLRKRLFFWTIDSPSNSLCENVVIHMPSLFSECPNKTSQLRRLAIAGDPENILRCVNPDADELELAINSAVQHSNFSWFEKIDPQPEWACWNMISYDITNIRFIRKPTYNICMSHLRSYGSNPYMAFQSPMWSFIKDAELREQLEYDLCEQLLHEKRRKINTK